MIDSGFAGHLSVNTGCVGIECFVLVAMVLNILLSLRLVDVVISRFDRCVLA